MLSRHFILVLLIIAAAVWTFWHFSSARSGPSGSPWRCWWRPAPAPLAGHPDRTDLGHCQPDPQRRPLRRGHVLDILTRANRIVMDKTGNPDHGNISLVSTQPLGRLTQPCLALPRPWRPIRAPHRPCVSKQTAWRTVPPSSDVTPVIGHGVQG